MSRLHRMTSRLLVAVLVSATFVLSAPFMGQIRAALRSAFPGRFVSIVGGAILVAVAAALVAALVRIRERRVARYGAIALALVIAVVYGVVSQTGNPDVDVVERVHFIEYGILTFLFYRVWKPAGDVSSLVMPVFAGVLVGTLDEWLQWFIPVRVGEARDVLLNLVAIVCGVLFGMAIDPPPAVSLCLHRSSKRQVAWTAAVLLLVFAAFVHAVHLGYLVSDDRWGAFRSHYSISELQALSAARTERWRVDPPIVLKRLSREDQYMDEGLWHIRRRNEAWEAGDYASAWRENVILETFFAPVLDTRSYATPQSSRWPPAQRDAAQSRGASSPTSYVSAAEPYPILTWSKWTFWSAVALASLAIVGAGLRKSD